MNYTAQAKLFHLGRTRERHTPCMMNVACASRSMHAHIGQHLHLLLGHNYMQLYIKMQYVCLAICMLRREYTYGNEDLMSIISRTF